MYQLPYDLLIWIPLLPLFGAIINGMFGRGMDRRMVQVIACGSVLGSFLIAIQVFRDLLMIVPMKRRFAHDVFTWVGVADLSINFKLMIDPLSIVMVLVITGVGFLIHLYSTEYMDHDKGGWKYFCYLNLFVFSMLLLVMGANLPVMFVGWEGVGLCSYLLIGFWFTEEANAKAGRKAFIVNRIGDFGFLLGMFLIYWAVGTLDFGILEGELLGEGKFIASGVAAAATLLLFIGATGKSAQIPLYVWLPDAMAGPTPVSALIHAATMVTAGIYMICRLNYLFVLAPSTMALIAGVGAATALVAATIAVVQTDIKKVLAYSTVSQLGFMFMGVGVGSFFAGMFHLLTHAFFKALLFLGSGSVIHGMEHAHAADDPQDIRTMGGLAKYMPITAWTFVIGTAAITGVPLLSGFFSKDEILWRTLATDFRNPTVWLVGTIAAAFTAFYMTRVTILTFFGTYRGRPDAALKIHDPGWRMSLPLIVLAGLSAGAGYLGLPHINPFHWPNLLGDFLEPVFRGARVASVDYVPFMGIRLGEAGAMGLSTLVAFGGIGLAFYMYLVRDDLPGKLARGLRPFHGLVANKYFVDEIYDLFIVRPLNGISRLVMFELADRRIIDLAVEGSARFVRGVGSIARLSQTGNLGTYIVYLVAGSIAVLIMLGGQG